MYSGVNFALHGGNKMEHDSVEGIWRREGVKMVCVVGEGRGGGGQG